MNHFTRVVIAYHGCAVELADRLISGELAISKWPLSRNAYDWLGDGIYFWEYGPQRARDWSIQNGRDGEVVGAYMQLGECLDLSDTHYTSLLVEGYHSAQEIYGIQGVPLPVNAGKKNELDSLIVNEVLDLNRKRGDDRIGFQTVRCPFLEGPPAFPGSKIRLQSHIQLSIIDTRCILGVFRPIIER